MTASIYAIVKNGSVENLVLWDGNSEEWSPPAGKTAVPVPAGAGVDIGWTYVNGKFSKPT